MSRVVIERLLNSANYSVARLGVTDSHSATAPGSSRGQHFSTQL